MKFFECYLARSRGILKISNPYNIHHSHKETKAESNDDNDLLLPRKTHLGQYRNGKKQDGQISGDVDGRRAKIQREDIGTLRIRRQGIGNGGIDGTTLKDVDKRQGQPGCIDDEQSNIVCPAEDRLASGQGQIEDEDGRFDGHQCRVLLHVLS